MEKSANPKRKNVLLLAENIPEKMQKLSTFEQLRIMGAQEFTDPDFKIQKQLLTGNARLDKNLKLNKNALKIVDLSEIDNRLASIDRSLLLLTKLTSDWDFNLLELKKLIQIIKEALPRSLNKKQVNSKPAFENVHRRMSQRTRAANWIEIQHACWLMMNEFPDLETSGRALMKEIVKNVKIRAKKDRKRNGLDWKIQMGARLTKWDEKKELY